jgi:cobalt-zinc-cadmium efflux system membrane fusion protein
MRLITIGLIVVALVGCDTSDASSGEDAPAPKTKKEPAQPEESPNQIRLGEGAQKRLEIRTEAVETGRLESSVEAPAKVRFNPDRRSHVSPLVAGQVSQMRVSVGDRVSAGDVVAVMRSPELGDARAAVTEAKVAVEVAEDDVERSRELREKVIISEREFIEAKGTLDQAKARLKAARSRLESLGVSAGSGASYPVRAGISGTVTEQLASVGETRGTGQPLVRIGDRSAVWVVAHVYESDAGKVKEGMDARVSVHSHPEAEWTGTVDWIGEGLEEATKTLPVRVVLENEDGRLRPGMFGHVRLMPTSVDDPVAIVPVDAVQRIGGREFVFVPGSQPGVYERREVQTGVESDGRVEIIDGLQDVDNVVSKGSFELKTAFRSR